MSLDRTRIAKGVPRSRYMIPLADTKDKKRILTYSSENMAKAAFSNGLGFYGQDRDEQFEAVEAELILKI